MPDSPSADNGVLFPLVDGRRSTQATSQAILAEAVRAVAPDTARSIERSRKWHSEYVPLLAKVEAASAQSVKAALGVASDGLDAVHRRMVFARDGSEVPLGEVFRGQVDPFGTATVEGDRERESELAVLYKGQALRGDGLRRQLDQWVDDGVVERSFATALAGITTNPDWLDARDLTVVVIGAAAEMGPLGALLRWGATVVAIDLPRERLWQQMCEQARQGSGRLLVPVRDDSAPSGDIAASAGCDLLTELPEIRAWLDTFSSSLVLGNYAYADGAAFVRVAAAGDALAADLTARRPDTALAYLASPTDVFAVGANVAEAARSRNGKTRRGRFSAAPLRTISGRRLFTPSYELTLTSEEGRQVALADSLVPQQGPNYALAKRLQRWRAVLAHESTVSSANVAPATGTRSVTKNRLLAAAYAGAGKYGVEVFDPESTSMLMAAKLMHDLRNPAAASQPGTTLEHPLQLFEEGAAHGGLWTSPWAPRSVLPLAAVEGLIRRG